jgi:hypothetical protein
MFPDSVRAVSLADAAPMIGLALAYQPEDHSPLLNRSHCSKQTLVAGRSQEVDESPHDGRYVAVFRRIDAPDDKGDFVPFLVASLRARPPLAPRPKA